MLSALALTIWCCNLQCWPKSGAAQYFLVHTTVGQAFVISQVWLSYCKFLCRPVRDVSFCLFLHASTFLFMYAILTIGLWTKRRTIYGPLGSVKMSQMGLIDPVVFAILRVTGHQPAIYGEICITVWPGVRIKIGLGDIALMLVPSLILTRSSLILGRETLAHNIMSLVKVLSQMGSTGLREARWVGEICVHCHRSARPGSAIIVCDRLWV